VLVGEAQAAVDLRERGVRLHRALAFDDFVRPATGEAEEDEEEEAGPARPNALAFHFGVRLREQVVLAALAAGALLQGLVASNSTHSRLRRRLSLLDIAVLGGHCEAAKALARANVRSALGKDIAALMQLETPNRGYELDGLAVRAAAMAGLPVQTMHLDVVQIIFEYPMRKSTKPFCLLDVAICLGQADLADQLAVQVAQHCIVTWTSCLTEAHLNCSAEMFPLSFWPRDWNQQEKKARFPNDNRFERAIAAVMAAAVLDQGRAEAMPGYLMLLAQWGRCFTRSSDGKIELSHLTLLRQICKYALPSTLLTLPRMLAHLNSLNTKGVAPPRLAANMRPADAALAVRGWLARHRPPPSTNSTP